MVSKQRVTSRDQTQKAWWRFYFEMRKLEPWLVGGWKTHPHLTRARTHLGQQVTRGMECFASKERKKTTSNHSEGSGCQTTLAVDKKTQRVHSKETVRPNVAVLLILLPLASLGSDWI